MSRYRRVLVQTWTDDKFQELTPLKPSGQALWLYLLTGRHTTAIPGLSGQGQGALSEQLRWPLRDVRRHWEEIERLEMGRADWMAPCIWLPKAIHHNKPESPNVVKGWRAHLSEIPPCPLRDEAMKAIRHVTEDIGYAFAEAFQKAFGEAFRNGSSGAFALSGSGKQDQEVPPKAPLEGGRITRRERQEAELVLRQCYGRCPHEPKCPNSETCVSVIARERRARVSA